MSGLIILVGQAPGSDPGEPLAGRIGERLAGLMKLTPEEYLRIERINILTEYPGSSNGRDRFPITKAREAAARIEAQLAGRRVVLFGRLTARAFGIGEATPWLTWHYVGSFVVSGPGLSVRKSEKGFDYALVPHPSGRNRWWNDAANAEWAGRFLARAGEKSQKSGE